MDLLWRRFANGYLHSKCGKRWGFCRHMRRRPVPRHDPTDPNNTVPEGHQGCNTCGEIKPLTAFAKSKSKKNGICTRCKDCTNKAHLNRRYGHGAAETKERLFKKQSGRCAICKGTTASMQRGDSKWALDHCHKTGRIRGVLCHRCNLTLGYLEQHEFDIEPFRQYADTVRKNLQD